MLFIKKKGRLLRKMKSQYIVVRNCTYYTKRELSMRHTQYKEENYHFLLCLLLLQGNSDLPSATVIFIGLPSPIANLHIRKAFTLICLSIDKSKCKTHQRYREYIERSQNTSNVMQMPLYN